MRLPSERLPLEARCLPVKCENSWRWLAAAFFALVFSLGLFTAGDYGPAWDETDEMDILRMNLWEYARAFGLDESAFEERARVALSSYGQCIMYIYEQPGKGDAQP